MRYDSVCKIDECFDAFILAVEKSAAFLLPANSAYCMQKRQRKEQKMEGKTEPKITIVKVTQDTKIKHITNMKEGRIIVDVQPGIVLAYLDICDILGNPNVERLNYQSPEKDSRKYRTIDGILYKDDKLIRCPIGRAGNIVIPEGITSIQNNAFEHCKISAVKFPKSLEYIGGYAFSYCLSLNDVDFGHGIRIISYNVFYGCIKLKEVTIPPQVLSIGDYAFASSGLRQINLSEGIQKIGEGAFCDCLKLTEIELPNTLLKDYLNTRDGSYRIRDICLHYVNKVFVSELTDEVIHTGIFNTSEEYQTSLVEIVTPDDTFYISKYAKTKQRLALTSDKIKSADFLDYEYSASVDTGDYATVKRYLYLVEHNRKVSGKMKGRIIKRWKNIIHFLLQQNDAETLLKLIRTDLARLDKVEYVLQEVSNVALKAYILEELLKKDKKPDFDI